MFDVVISLHIVSISLPVFASRSAEPWPRRMVVHGDYFRSLRTSSWTPAPAASASRFGGLLVRGRRWRRRLRIALGRGGFVMRTVFV